MKKNLFLILIISLLQSCSNLHISDSQTAKITKVETSLTYPIFIEGTSTWSIKDRMEHYGVPGVSIAVINDSKIEWVKSYGVIDKKSQIPVSSQTLFQAGSISKPVAAYGALRLVDQNKINLDENVNTYLQSWKLSDNEFTKTKKVALKHLLSHSGGLTVHGFLGYSPDLPVPSLTQVLDGKSPANSAPIFVDKIPEESFRYSGGGYCIAQQMMIDVEGKPFPELMHSLVLQPLGMKNSTYDQPLSGEQLKMAATGYLPDGSMTKGKRHTYPEMAAAGLWTTAEDLAKFAINIQHTLRGQSSTVLSQKMVDKMLTPFVEEYSGLGIFLNKIKDEVYFGHGGWDEGFSSELIAHKDKGYGVVILTNSNHPAFISELIRSVALTYKWSDFMKTYQAQKMDPNELEKISGRYRVNNGKLIQIYQFDNRLFRQVPGEDPLELFKISDESFISQVNDKHIQFQANPENEKLDLIIKNPENGAIESVNNKMQDDEKLPIELLVAGNFEQAYEAYESLSKQDPSDPAVNENNLNQVGYNFLNSEKLKLAQDIFKINTLLYPNSSNVYDSYAEACMRVGELDLAIANYNKSLSLDSKNDNAVKMLEEINKKKEPKG